MQAYALVNSEEWVFNTDIPSALSSFTEIIPLQSKVMLELDLIKELSSNYKIENETHRALAGVFQTNYITQPREDYLLAFRLRQFCVYKLGKASKDGLLKFLGIVAAGYALTPITGPLAWIAPGIAGWEFIKSIVLAYERIEDPDEKMVFETIYILERRPIIVDYRAYEKEDFLNAYGHAWPNIDDLNNELNGKLTEKELKKALVSLKARGIISNKQNRWQIKL